MKKIGIFYAAKADKTSWVAEKIQKEFGASAESVAIEMPGRMILKPMIIS